MGTLFGGGKSNSTTPTRYNSMQLQRSAYGMPVPLVYGQCRVPPFLMWYGDFVSTPHTQSAGGKGGGGPNVTNYTYTAALMLGLCEGPINSIASVYDNSTVHTNIGDLNFTQIGLGTTGQAIWSYLSTNHPTQAVPYSDIAYVGAAPYNLGSSAGLPNLTFEVAGLQWGGAVVLDAAPWPLINDYFTDPKHGAGFAFLAPITGVNDFSTYVVAMGMYISYNENTQRAAIDFLKEVLQICNTGTVVTGDGLLHLIPFADVAVSGNSQTYTPNLTPLFTFTDDDFCPKTGEDPVQLQRLPYSQTYNYVPVEYEDRTNKYNTSIAYAADDNDVALNGTRVMPTVSLHAIKNAVLAKQVATLILNRNLYYRNTYVFRVRPDYSGLEPMDLISFSDTGLGVNNALCRVTQVDDSEADEIQITCEEMPIGPATTPLYNWQAAQGFAANMNAAPGSVQTPYIFRMPAGLSNNNVVALGIAVCGPNNGVWGGCQVWISFDNVNYEFVGAISAPARYGTLTSAFATGSDPDTTNTCSVTLNDTALTMAGGAQADADQMRTLCLVDGEVISYETANLVSAGKYNLTTYLRRGQYGSTIGAHLINANWARLDNAVMILPLDMGYYGQTIYFKFPSFNTYRKGQQTLAAATAYTYVPPVALAASDCPFTATGNASVQTLPNGHRGSKNIGISAWDSAINAVKAYQSVAISGVVSQATQNLMVGLSTINTNTSYTTLNFAIYQQSTSNYQIYENGNNIQTIAIVPQKGDVLAVWYDGRTVRYYINGLLKRAASTQPGLTLYGSVVFLSVGATIEHLEYGSSGTGTLITAGNFLNTWVWRIGVNGSQGNFTQLNSGGGTPNSVILGDGSALTAPLGPFGQAEPLWKVVTPAVSSSVNGFTDSLDTSGLDGSKSYRYSVWVRYTGSGANCGLYVGTDSGGGSVDNLSPGSADPNPYFCLVGTMSNISADKWYLAVGVIHGAGYSTTTQSGISGLYDPVTGQRVSAAVGNSNNLSVAFGSDFKFSSTAIVQTVVRALFFPTAAVSATGFFCRPRFEEMNGQEPNIWTIMHPAGTIDPSSGKVLALGSMPPTILDVGLSWAIASGQITLSWSGFTLYRPDGTTTAISANAGFVVTGLTNGINYTVYPYVAEGSTTLSFATGATGAVGSPACMYAGGSPQGAQTAYLFGHVPLNSVSGIIPSAGGGSGGGGHTGCPHPDSQVQTMTRGMVPAGQLEKGDVLITPTGGAVIQAISRQRKAEWIVVKLRGLCSDPYESTVTGEHVYYEPGGEMIRARELRLGSILQGDGSLLRVVGLALLEREAEAVVISLPDPHVYYERLDGALAHNGNPKP